MQTEQFIIDGMGCMGCARIILSTLIEVNGVENAQVDFPTKTAQIDYNPQLASINKLQVAVKEAGYELIKER